MSILLVERFHGESSWFEIVRDVPRDRELANAIAHVLEADPIVFIDNEDDIFTPYGSEHTVASVRQHALNEVENFRKKGQGRDTLFQKRPDIEAAVYVRLDQAVRDLERFDQHLKRLGLND